MLYFFINGFVQSKFLKKSGFGLYNDKCNNSCNRKGRATHQRWGMTLGPQV